MSTEETGLVVREERPKSLLIGTPNERVVQATEIAHALAPVIERQHLYVNISGRRPGSQEKGDKRWTEVNLWLS